MSGYVKIYQSILDSSVWQEDGPTRLVWITMLAMADKNGCLEASTGGIARRANVELETCKRALERLSSPDPDDKSGVLDGIRIQKIERGWFVVNHKHYRDLRTSEQIAGAERVRRHREKTKTVTSNDVTACNAGTGVVVGSVSSSDRKKATGKPRAEAPVALPDDWQPSEKKLAALAESLGVSVTRLQSQVADFRWYWTEGDGHGEKKTLRGWAATFGNRMGALAKRGTLYAEPTGQSGQTDAQQRIVYTG